MFRPFQGRPRWGRVALGLATQGLVALRLLDPGLRVDEPAGLVGMRAKFDLGIRQCRGAGNSPFEGG